MSRTPVIDADRCSLGRLARATCSACAQACPRAALTASDDGLELDPSACSSCGACAAACPAEAISLGGIDRPVPDRRTAVEAWLACPRHPLGHRGGAPLCLQAIGMETLARFWLSGLRRVACLTADCATCPDGAGLPLDARVAAFNALLASRGLPALGFRSALAPPRGAARLRPGDAAEPDAARRRMFGLTTASPPRRTALPPALARVQGLGEGTGRLFADVPRILPSACTGCNACTMVCPTGAISLMRDQTGGLAYATDPALCTGCRLCLDVCSDTAIVLDRLAPAADPLRLIAFHCPGCGVTTYLPEGSPQAEADLCPVCRKGLRGQRLRHVID
ncbi:4Fe-4S binding protein [Rhodobacter sp. Har01]|uniref:4Fe-4S dicluster domain-containing protein n=1 Tax=Rhodobacter sp. Har01 TaxID=2883999 RepID=UPI001D07C0AC|nr:4Fe-4S dicluster domain-containing protein [Rhodobacter sp. Har01]MCB6179101.1 4Fe-4S binding protein [Rhodobacter sp. Har01]